MPARYNHFGGTPTCNTDNSCCTPGIACNFGGQGAAPLTRTTVHKALWHHLTQQLDPSASYKKHGGVNRNYTSQLQGELSSNKYQLFHSGALRRARQSYFYR